MVGWLMAMKKSRRVIICRSFPRKSNSLPWISTFPLYFSYSGSFCFLSLHWHNATLIALCKFHLMERKYWAKLISLGIMLEWKRSKILLCSTILLKELGSHCKLLSYRKSNEHLNVRRMACYMVNIQVAGAIDSNWGAVAKLILFHVTQPPAAAPDTDTTYNIYLTNQRSHKTC